VIITQYLIDIYILGVKKEKQLKIRNNTRTINLTKIRHKTRRKIRHKTKTINLTKIRKYIKSISNDM
jgi:hypothetical protein